MFILDVLWRQLATIPLFGIVLKGKQISRLLISGQIRGQSNKISDVNSFITTILSERGRKADPALVAMTHVPPGNFRIWRPTFSWESA